MPLHILTYSLITAFNVQENAVFIPEFSKKISLPWEGETLSPSSVASLPRFAPPLKYHSYARVESDHALPLSPCASPRQKTKMCPPPPLQILPLQNSVFWRAWQYSCFPIYFLFLFFTFPFFLSFNFSLFLPFFPFLFFLFSFFLSFPAHVLRSFLHTY